MKLTKKLEAEILKVYNEVWDAYLRGDMRTFASILDENCYIIGSAAGEVFSNKKAAVKYYKSTAEQITGKAEFRNRKIKVMPVEKGVMVNEKADFYLLIDDQWTFYGPGRISSLFHKKNNKWKVIHQHGSFPDSKTEEGEQVNTDKIKAENIQLRNAVKRRTEELENKNRELEIESALERVRARAMSMQSSDELVEVANVMRQQMVELGQSGFDTAAVHLYSDDPEYFDSWYSFRQGDPVTGKIVTGKTKFKKDACKMLREMVKAYHSKESDYTIKGSGEKLREWFSFLAKTIPEIKINLDKNPRSNYIHFSDFSGGSLVMATYEPPTKDSMLLQKRCAVVFDLAYRRYIDLKKAEAQAREAQIEAALERVRSRSMGMQKSSELVDVVHLLDSEITGLGIMVDNTSIITDFSEFEKGLNNWTALRGKSYLEKFHIPYNDDFVVTKLMDAITNGVDYYTEKYSRVEKNKYFRWLFKYSDFKKIPNERQQFVFDTPGWTRAIVISKNSLLVFQRYKFEEFTEEEGGIFKRFGKVFEQSYTRFLDLQKAEEQAREAGIELSLERVRAKAMAMQKPSEFVDVINIIGEQLIHLGFDIDWANFGANGFDISEGIDIWNFGVVPGASPISARVFFPYFDHPVFTTAAENVNEFLNGGRDLITVTLDKQAKDTWLDHMFTNTIFKDIPEEYRVIQYGKPGYTTSNISLKDTWLSIGKFDIKNFTDEQHAIFRRFANAFGQAYTRFLDLQKAEAQAREAQIEASLERVRSRAMAMQNSDELKELIGTVFTELTKLDIVLTRCLIMIYDPRSNDSIWWMANSEAPTQPIGLKVQYHEYPSYLAYVNAWKQKELKWTYTLEGNTKKEWDDFLFVETELSHLPDFVIAGMKAPDRVYLNASFNSFGNLTLATLEPLSAEHFDIMLRFAKVFDLTYTRFNDLQKAEAQTREAQIELALERVRARTMAMHKSEELAETAEVLYHQLKELGDDPERITIGLLNDDTGVITWWATDQGGSKLNIKFQATIDEPTVMLKLYNSWKAKNESLVIDLSGKELAEWVKYCREVIGVPIKEELLKNRRVQTAGFFSHGWLMITSPEPTAAKTINILERFASVFNLTYRRFLDLQKAEAQAREAQIEAALEKVRASAMAMHNSNDISSTTTIIFIELKKLGIQSIRCGIGLLSKKSPAAQVYAATTTPDRELATLRRSISMTDHPALQQQYESWLKQENYIQELKQDELRSYYQLPFFYSSANYIPPENFEQSELGYYIPFSEGVFYAWTKKGYSNDEINILNRFKAIVDLTFRRYLDLQKAEAQARDAQIEASLERVRSKTMAMHNSQDVGDTVASMFDELVKLGVETVRCGIGIMHEPNQMEVWTAKKSKNEKVELIIGRLDMTIHPLLQGMYNGWKNKDVTFSYELRDNDLVDYFTKLINSPEYHINYDIASLPQHQFHNDFYFPEGALFSFSAEQLSTEASQIFKRFAGVFGQTYRRYLDLQKAEAQVREAQIEAVLERVRSRTMAMQKSDELTDVAGLLFAQVSALGIKTWTAGFNVWSEDNNSYVDYITSPQGGFIEPYTVYTDTAEALTDISNARKSGVEFDVQYVEGEKIKQLYLALTKLDEKQYEIMLQDGVRFPSHQYEHFVFGSKVSLMFITYEPVPEAYDIFKRLGKVFEQTYTRFLDLQKAEASAREAQIEASLERVRASAMAMHRSDELSNVLAILFEQFDVLKIQPVDVHLDLFDLEKNTFSYRATGKEGKRVIAEQIVDLDSRPEWQALLQKWKNGKPNTVDFSYYPKEVIRDLMAFFPDIWAAMPEDAIMSPEDFPNGIFDALGYCKFGYIGFHHHRKATEEEQRILIRFANEFERLYQRFLDLQKAEAQAREAQIEASLERVRSKTMAMHNSQDVGDTVATMLDELVKLGVETVRCGIAIIDESKTMEVWTASSKEDGSVKLIIGKLDMRIHPLFMHVYDVWKNKALVTAYELIGEDLKDYFRVVNNSPEYPIRYDIDSLPYSQWNTSFMFPEGLLFVFSQEPLAIETTQIFKRFAGVFGQTYRRYLDLQKAEAQAREALIEAGLERVRARTMAMHSSDDVSIATATMFTELEKLGIENFRGGITNIHTNRTQEVWSVNNLAEGKSVKAVGIFNMDAHPFWQQMYEEWVNKKDFVYTFLTGKEKEDYIKILNATQGYLSQTIQEFPDVHFQVYAFNEGGVWTNSLKPHTEEEKQIMKRFASVFSLTFRRYQDLQKAEAQTREATIEAALEKVRGKAMAMHNSNDLTATASLVFTELRKLGISPMRCGVGILNKENRKALLYTAIASEEGDSLSQIGWVLLDVDPVLRSIYDQWSRGEDYFPVLKKEMLRSFYEQLRSGFEVPEEQTKYEHHGYFLQFSEGVFYGWSENPFTGSEIKVLKRFASVIDLTFRRYIELQKSETNAREAVKQAALDRVRAEIASMRTINDLDRITPLIWNELTILGIPFIRCGVFIMDNEQELIHTFLSTPDGKAIAAFHLPYDTPGNLRHVVTNWKKNKKYIDHWDETEFIQFADILVKGGALISAEQYLKTIPKGGFYLHFLPFLQGMLYVGNTTQLKQEEIELIQHVADAFSTAYARYEDFNKLESAKQQVEKTLTDLKQAQTQLVQSEKMASLGEMTAGIAHEIQNPLNFVNNFSEVSKELLDEMKTELDTGNTEDAKDIADDVIQNLEKINHHGKRADAIVKSMLQHSRSSSGKKEPADINGLADEYLRLAYHGLRAKDKSFNAKFETEFDSSIGKINIISQDIGRVLVNLINNAFYAVSEKKKQESNGYEPTVTVYTKKIDDKIEIKVRDNGNGIPQKVLDKIFQPFFTTKPTGQGTGLGLSLAYDIITKGHGGELKVETREGEGSEFIIQLPNQSS